MHMEDGDFDDETHHTNWELMSTVCYLFVPSMRRCIAQMAYAFQQEVEALRSICLELKIDCSDLGDYEDFDFEMALSKVQDLYTSSIDDTESTDRLKQQIPMLYNMMRPASKAQCKYKEDRRASRTYELMGAGNVKRQCRGRSGEREREKNCD